MVLVCIVTTGLRRVNAERAFGSCSPVRVYTLQNELAPLNPTGRQPFSLVSAALVSSAHFGSCFVPEQKETRVITNDFVLWFRDLGPLIYIGTRCLIRTG
jgi:hypothetical protein